MRRALRNARTMLWPEVDGALVGLVCMVEIYTSLITWLAGLHQNTQASSHHSYLYLQITLLTSNPRIHFAVVSVTYDSLKHSQPKINIFANSSLSSQSPLRFACYSLICSQFFSLMYTFMCLTGTKNPEDCNNLESSILEKTYIYAVNELTLSERIRHWLYKAYRYWVDCTQFIPSTWITPPSTFLKGALYISLNEWMDK